MPFLSTTIDSVLNQDFQDFELIISDDGSEDGTSQYLASLTDARIFVTSPSSPLKVDEHWTFVCGLAKGMYIKLLCADDVLPPGALSRQIQTLNDNEVCDLVVSSRRIINIYGRTILENHGRGNHLGIHPGAKVLRESFKSGTNILGEPSGLIFRTSALIPFLPWNNRFPYMLDFELYTRALPSMKVIFLESIDSEFRVHGSSISAKASQSHYLEFLQLYEETLSSNTSALKFSFIENLRMKLAAFIKNYIRAFIFKFAQYF
jgi:glycosyltransferase involved in cell wall biosynthesis